MVNTDGGVSRNVSMIGQGNSLTRRGGSASREGHHPPCFRVSRTMTVGGVQEEKQTGLSEGALNSQV